MTEKLEEKRGGKGMKTGSPSENSVGGICVVQDELVKVSRVGKGEIRAKTEGRTDWEAAVEEEL